MPVGGAELKMADPRGYIYALLLPSLTFGTSPNPLTCTNGCQVKVKSIPDEVQDRNLIRTGTSWLTT